MPPLQFQGLDFNKNSFVANEALAGAISNFISDAQAARQAKLLSRDLEAKTANQIAQTREEYAPPGDILINMMKLRSGDMSPALATFDANGIPMPAPGAIEPGMPTADQVDPTTGAPLDPTGVPLSLGVPPTGTAPAGGPLTAAEIAAQAKNQGPTEDMAPAIEGDAGPDTAAPDAGAGNLAAAPDPNAPAGADGFQMDFESAYDVAEKTKQDIAAFLGQSPVVAADALEMYAKFTPDEVAKAAKMEYTALMISKLGDVPGGRIQSPYGTKSRWAGQDKLSLEEKKLAARAARDAQTFAGRADERSIKLLKVLSSNMLGVQQNTLLQNIMNPKNPLNPDKEIGDFNATLLPQLQNIADGMGIPLNQGVLDQYVKTLQGAVYDQLASNNADSDMYDKAAKLFAALKGAGAGVLKAAVGDGDPNVPGDKKPGTTALPQAVKSEGEASIKKLMDAKKITRAEAVKIVLGTPWAKKNKVTSANLQ